jgi:hypothetical protein
MIGNPRGLGKSSLVMEIAYKRNDICLKRNISSGTVLFTDFRGIKSDSDAEERIMKTIQPLFLSSYFQFDNEKGSLFCFVCHLFV